MTVKGFDCIRLSRYKKRGYGVGSGLPSPLGWAILNRSYRASDTEEERPEFGMCNTAANRLKLRFPYYSLTKRDVSIQFDSVTDSQRHGILDPEGVVQTAQVEGLGLCPFPRDYSLSPVRASLKHTD